MGNGRCTVYLGAVVVLAVFIGLMFKESDRCCPDGKELRQDTDRQSIGGARTCKNYYNQNETRCDDPMPEGGWDSKDVDPKKDCSICDGGEIIGCAVDKKKCGYNADIARPMYAFFCVYILIVLYSMSLHSAS